MYSRTFLDAALDLLTRSITIRDCIIRSQDHYKQLSHMSEIQTEDEIIGKECRFIIPVLTKTPGEDDWHIVKEVIHYKSGRTERKLRALKNYERPMWMTKPQFRNHKEKKESEHVEKLLVKKVRESDLRNEIAKALDKSWSRESKRELCSSPYVYGTDISASTIIKQMLYKRNWPNIVSSYSICYFDTETNMYDDDNTIIIASILFEGKVVLIVRKDMVHKYTDPHVRFQRMVDTYLKDRYGKGDGKELPFDIEFVVADDEISIVKEAFKCIHAWKPDFLAIWNMNYDVPKVLDACKRAGVAPEDILCDPAIPKHMRYCKYKKGQDRKVTAAGKSQPLAPSAQWHTLFLTASFYVIDAMCSYRLLRLSQQELAYYDLDFVLKANKLGGKFKFAEADGYEKEAWHKFMQSNYIFEYMIYAIGDVYEMHLLEEKTKDLQSTLPGFAVTTDFWEFNSQPKRLRDAIFWDWLFKHNRIIATVGPQEKEVEAPVMAYGNENDDGFDEDEVGLEDEHDPATMKVLSRNGWVLTLPAHNNVLGLRLALHEPMLQTLIRAFTYDSDAVSAYPKAAIVTNYSKATTRKELTGVRGISESVFRLQNMNLVVGNVNANDYCRTMFKMPRSKQLLADFMKEA